MTRPPPPPPAVGNYFWSEVFGQTVGAQDGGTLTSTGQFVLGRVRVRYITGYGVQINAMPTAETKLLVLILVRFRCVPRCSIAPVHLLPQRPHNAPPLAPVVLERGPFRSCRPGECLDCSRPSDMVCEGPILFVLHARFCFVLTLTSGFRALAPLRTSRWGAVHAARLALGPRTRSGNRAWCGFPCASCVMLHHRWHFQNTHTPSRVQQGVQWLEAVRTRFTNVQHLGLVGTTALLALNSSVTLQ